MMIMASVVDNVVYTAMMSLLRVLFRSDEEERSACPQTSYGTIFSVVGLAMNCMAACKMQSTTTACYSTSRERKRESSSYRTSSFLHHHAPACLLNVASFFLRVTDGIGSVEENRVTHHCIGKRKIPLRWTSYGCVLHISQLQVHTTRYDSMSVETSVVRGRSDERRTSRVVCSSTDGAKWREGKF